MATWNENRIQKFKARKSDPSFLLVDQWERSVLSGWLATDQGSIVLDVPCGYGRFFSLLQGSAKRLIAIDADPTSCQEALEYARRLGINAKVLRMNALIAELPQADVVWCLRFWTHLEQQAADNFLGKLVKAAPVVFLQINEANGTTESRVIQEARMHRLDSVARVSEIAAASGARVLRTERLDGTSSCLLHIVRNITDSEQFGGKR